MYKFFLKNFATTLEIINVVTNHDWEPQSYTQPTQTFRHTTELEFNFSWRMGFIPETDQQFLGYYL